MTVEKVVKSQPHSINARLTSFLFRYHRWFGVVSCLVVILWGASGVMHPIMSRINPTPVNMQPPSSVPMLHVAQTPDAVLAKAGIQSVVNVRAMAWEGVSYYQVTLPGQGTRRYFEVNSGSELAGGDVKYAEYLARHFIGDQQSKLKSISLVTTFDEDYLDINRLLPVYRVELQRNNGLRAYIETNPPRISALVDNRKALLGKLFRWMHNWDFMRDADTLRMVLISGFLATALLSALSGIWMYGFMWRRGTLRKYHLPLRRWHRSVGIIVSLSSLMFVVSAEWHLLGSERRTVLPILRDQLLVGQLALPAAVQHGSWGAVNMLEVDGKLAYQLLPVQQNGFKPSAEHDHSEAPAQGKNPQTVYVDAQSTLLNDAARNHAIWLAGKFSGLPSDQVGDTSVIRKFEGEYGFLNKRLPVWKVSYKTPEHLTYYVETSSNALAATVRDSDRAEGWSFSYLHKYHWLDFAGKDVRDLVMGVFGLGNLLIAVLGLWMFTRRYTKFTGKVN